MSNFGSYVKALRKVSTHLMEEPIKRPYYPSSNFTLWVNA